MTKFLWYVSSLVVWFSFLWAYKDGCMPNVIIAIVATALACWSLSKEVHRR